MVQCCQHNRCYCLTIVEGMGIAECIRSELGPCQTLGWQVLHDRVRLPQQLEGRLGCLFGHPLQQAYGWCPPQPPTQRRM